MAQILCTYCFNKFSPQQVLYRCSNAACRGSTEDEVYGKSHDMGIYPVMPPVLPSPEKSWFKFGETAKPKCQDCRRETTIRICPECHDELHADAGHYEETLIAVIGGRSAGKSIYITVLIKELRERVTADFNLTLLPRGDQTTERYQDDFHTYVYDQRILPPSTESSSRVKKVKVPLIYRIKFPGIRPKILSLILFDSAGEDMKSLNTMSNEARYIAYADAVIFLLDPLQIPKVRTQVASSVTLPTLDPIANPWGIIDSFISLRERVLGKREKNVMLPVAFTLAKIDTLTNLIDAGSALHRTSEHRDKAYNNADGQTVHTEIQGYLEEWMGRGFTTHINEHFTRYRFCAMSALGAEPQGAKIVNFNPRRIEDPLLWILRDFGLISSKG